MRWLGRKSGFQWLAVLVGVGLFLLPGLAQSDEPDAAAVAFGSYPAVWGARLSPDGKRIVYLRMHESDLPVAEVFDIEKKQVNIVAASKKHEYDVNFCHWANNDRLLCSSGYGDEWLGEGGFRDWRTTVNDITDGARYLVETGQADPDRMCIVGWSYGGYAALLSGVEEPSLYRCVVSIAGIGDLKDLAEEEKRYLYSKVAAETFGKDDRILKAGSPARRAKEMGAPTLLFHGDEDINVRIAHSEKMNKALKKADKEVTFIEYEEVEHSLRRNAVRIDMLDRMGEFLDTHTQPLPPPHPETGSIASAPDGGP